MVCFFGINIHVNAQDIHWTQFHNSLVYLNPALTAVFKGDTRFAAHYRSQWNTVPVNYLTFSGAADTKFFAPKLRNSMFGAGLILNHDKAGDSHLTATQVALSGAYTARLAKKHFLSVGLQVSLAQMSFGYEDLRFKNQYDGDIYRASLPHLEPTTSNRTSFGDFSAGINYHFQIPEKRTKLDLGVAMHHINEPVRSFYESADVRLPNRLNFYGVGELGLGERVDLILRATAQFQGPHTEIVPSAAIRFWTNITPTQKTAFQLGAAYRFHNEEPDAIAPVLEFFYQRWHVGLSYDINISDFQVATGRYGAPEMSITYVITEVRMERFKICPIF